MRAVMILILVLACIGCNDAASTSAGPPEAERDGGVRIVSLTPAGSKLLVDMGLGDRIVGRHNYDQVVDRSVPAVGDQGGIDYERLIGLKPTHVVTEWGARSPPTRLEDLGASQGFELVNISTLTLGEIVESARRLENVFGVGSELSSELDLVFSQRSEPRPTWGTVLLVMQTSPTVDCLGPGSAHHELLVRSGYTPAIAEGSPYVPLDAEDVLTLDPGVIVLIRPRSGKTAEGHGSAADLGVLAGLGLGAVERGRVVLIDDPLALLPSSSLLGYVRALQRGLEALGPLGSPREDTTDNGQSGPG
ncbi:MAG TPA: hypothetical protein ENJ00_04240 [Phycisphaerales bacterium]|nr:hypothetical protein [Phycisphaerales bacterium]